MCSQSANACVRGTARSVGRTPEFFFNPPRDSLARRARPGSMAVAEPAFCRRAFPRVARSRDSSPIGFHPEQHLVAFVGDDVVNRIGSRCVQTASVFLTFAARMLREE